MVQIIKPERPKFEPEIVNMLRGDDEGGETSEIVLSVLDQNRRNPIHKRVGLWLDRKKAVIVSIANNIEARRIITSDMEHCTVFHGCPRRWFPGEYTRQAFLEASWGIL